MVSTGLLLAQNNAPYVLVFPWSYLLNLCLWLLLDQDAWERWAWGNQAGGGAKGRVGLVPQGVTIPGCVLGAAGLSRTQRAG